MYWSNLFTDFNRTGKIEADHTFDQWEMGEKCYLQVVKAQFLLHVGGTVTPAEFDLILSINITMN